jgi:phosphatidylserine/phosphatidylglycerophosphate/cardiolipin synthase-like enzyme
VKIFEYQPSVLHAKTLVADGLISVVGSSNRDFRSFVFTAECNLMMLDRGTACELETAFERDLGDHSRRLEEPGLLAPHGGPGGAVAVAVAVRARR